MFTACERKITNIHRRLESLYTREGYISKKSRNKEKGNKIT